MGIVRIWLILLVLVCAGCGDSGKPVDAPAPSAMVKATLQDLATTGEMTNAVDSLEQQLLEMKATDPAKADALLADYQQLRTLPSPQAVKTKAKAMLEKL